MFYNLSMNMEGPQINEKDSQGRTREDVIKILSDHDFLVDEKVVFDEGEFKVDGMTIEKYISFQDELDNPETDSSLSKQYKGFH